MLHGIRPSAALLLLSALPGAALGDTAPQRLAAPPAAHNPAVGAPVRRAAALVQAPASLAASLAATTASTADEDASLSDLTDSIRSLFSVGDSAEAPPPPPAAEPPPPAAKPAPQRAPRGAAAAAAAQAGEEKGPARGKTPGRPASPQQPSPRVRPRATGNVSAAAPAGAAHAARAPQVVTQAANQSAKRRVVPDAKPAPKVAPQSHSAAPAAAAPVATSRAPSAPAAKVAHDSAEPPPRAPQRKQPPAAVRAARTAKAATGLSGRSPKHAAMQPKATAAPANVSRESNTSVLTEKVVEALPMASLVLGDDDKSDAKASNISSDAKAAVGTTAMSPPPPAVTSVAAPATAAVPPPAAAAAAAPGKHAPLAAAKAAPTVVAASAKKAALQHEVDVLRQRALEAEVAALKAKLARDEQKLAHQAQATPVKAVSDKVVTEKPRGGAFNSSTVLSSKRGAAASNSSVHHHAQHANPRPGGAGVHEATAGRHPPPAPASPKQRNSTTALRKPGKTSGSLAGASPSAHLPDVTRQVTRSRRLPAPSSPKRPTPATALRKPKPATGPLARALAPARMPKTEATVSQRRPAVAAALRKPRRTSAPLTGAPAAAHMSKPPKEAHARALGQAHRQARAAQATAPRRPAAPAQTVRVAAAAAAKPGRPKRASDWGHLRQRFQALSARRSALVHEAAQVHAATPHRVPSPDPLASGPQQQPQGQRQAGVVAAVAAAAAAVHPKPLNNKDVERLPMSGLVSLDSSVAPAAVPASAAETTVDTTMAPQAQPPQQPTTWFGAFIAWLTGTAAAPAPAPARPPVPPAGKKAVALLESQEPRERESQQTALDAREEKNRQVFIGDAFAQLETEEQLRAEDEAARVEAETPGRPRGPSPGMGADPLRSGVSHASKFWGTMEEEDNDIEAALSDGTGDFTRFQQLSRTQEAQAAAVESQLQGEPQGDAALQRVKGRRPDPGLDEGNIHEPWFKLERQDADEVQRIRENPTLQMLQVGDRHRRKETR